MSKADPIDALADALRSVGVPVHSESLFDLQGSWFDAVWLLPDGVHYCPAIVSLGHLAHEAGHWALISPEDRARVQPGSLREQSIWTCGEDFAVECWMGAIAQAADLDLELFFGDLDDYAHGLKDTAIDPEMFALRQAVHILAGKHPGVALLEVLGMTTRADYPAMSKWLADADVVARHLDLEERAEIDRDRRPSSLVEIAHIYQENIFSEDIGGGS